MSDAVYGWYHRIHEKFSNDQVERMTRWIGLAPSFCTPLYTEVIELILDKLEERSRE